MSNKAIEKKRAITEIDLKDDKVIDMTDDEKKALFSSTNYALISQLIDDVIPTSISKIKDLSQDSVDEAGLHVKTMMSSILTGNGLETILASQMVAVHNLQMKAATYAKHLEHSFSITPYVNMVTKLSNTFIQQAQLLNKLQGKGQQKVTVEHVNVHKGGQAIVGNVTNNQGAENHDGKN